MRVFIKRILGIILWAQDRALLEGQQLDSQKSRHHCYHGPWTPHNIARGNNQGHIHSNITQKRATQLPNEDLPPTQRSLSYHLLPLPHFNGHFLGFCLCPSSPLVRRHFWECRHSRPCSGWKTWLNGLFWTSKELNVSHSDKAGISLATLVTQMSETANKGGSAVSLQEAILPDFNTQNSVSQNPF